MASVTGRMPAAVWPAAARTEVRVTSSTTDDDESDEHQAGGPRPHQPRPGSTDGRAHDATGPDEGVERVAPTRGDPGPDGAARRRRPGRPGRRRPGARWPPARRRPGGLGSRSRRGRSAPAGSARTSGRRGHRCRRPPRDRPDRRRRRRSRARRRSRPRGRAHRPHRGRGRRRLGAGPAQPGLGAAFERLAAGRERDRDRFELAGRERFEGRACCLVATCPPVGVRG